MEDQRAGDYSTGNLSRRDVLTATGGVGSVALAGCSTNDGDDENCDLSFEKSLVGSTQPQYGQQRTYIFEICNVGNEDCHSYPLEIVDELPTGVTFVSNSSGWYSNVSGNTVTLTTHIGLAPGFCSFVQMTVAIGSQAEVGTDEIENCATLNHGESGVEETCATHQIPQTGECSLSLQKGVDSAFEFGQQGTYTFTVCNTGDADCTESIVVDETLPTGITFDSVTGGWTANASGNTVTLENDTYGTLAPGECLTFDVVVNVDSQTTPDVITNCAVLTYEEQSDESCIQHQISGGDEPRQCLLSLEKGVAGDFQVGQQGTYTFSVCNEGDNRCGDPLQITDTLPAGITFGSVSGGWTATVSGNAVTLENDTYGQLNPGDCLTFEMVVNIDSGSQIAADVVTNCAVLSYEGNRDRSCIQHPITEGDGEPGECDIDYSFNSGYNNQAGTTLSDGDLDNIWRIIQDTTGSGTVPRTASVVDMAVVNARWGSQFADTRWISHTSDAQVPSAGQTVTYQYTFCLHPDFHDPDLSLRVHAEDEVADIRLNGASLPFTGDGNYQGTPIDESYTDPQDFQVGGNDLEIEIVENSTGEASGVNIEGSIRAKDANCECGNH